MKYDFHRFDLILGIGKMCDILLDMRDTGDCRVRLIDMNMDIGNPYKLFVD